MEENYLQTENSSSTVQYCSATMVSPEIVEIFDDGRSVNSNGEITTVNDVYVAVGKDDLDVLKWALDHCVLPGSRVFLVHVFSPITYIATPVGRLSRNQLSPDQVRVYINEDNNRRRSILQKYIRLCADAKLNVDTVLIEHNSVTKAILELIPVLNITKLVMGAKRSPYPRLIMKKSMKGEFVRKNAPDYCEVTVVYDGQQNRDCRKSRELGDPCKSSTSSVREAGDDTDRKFFELGCFSVCRPNARETQQRPGHGHDWQNGIGERN